MSRGENDLVVTVDPTTCQGYGICLGIAPDLFEMPAESPVAVVRRGATEAERHLVMEAIRGCPAHAITVKTAPR